MTRGAGATPALCSFEKRLHRGRAEAPGLYWREVPVHWKESSWQSSARSCGSKALIGLYVAIGVGEELPANVDQATACFASGTLDAPAESSRLSSPGKPVSKATPAPKEGAGVSAKGGWVG